MHAARSDEQGWLAVLAGEQAAEPNSTGLGGMNGPTSSEQLWCWNIGMCGGDEEGAACIAVSLPKIPAQLDPEFVQNTLRRASNRLPISLFKQLSR